MSVLPLVSVIMPSYNHAAYVERALESVYAQTYPNIELIVLDDCSKDETPQIIEKWLERENVRTRFRTIHFIKNDVNAGAHANLNRGMSMAEGQYFCFLNSDDFFSDRRIDMLLQTLQKNGARFAFSSVMPVNDKGEETLQGQLAKQIILFRDMISAMPSVSFGFLRWQLAVSTGNFFIHRSLYEEIGGFSPLKYCHDWDFALRAFLKTEPVFVDEYLYFYRLHGSNSFLELGNVARLETEAVLRNFYVRMLQSHAENPFAPTCHNWPGVFEHYIDLFELEHLWKIVCKENGYVSPYVILKTDEPRLSRYSNDADESKLSLTDLREAAYIAWIGGRVRTKSSLMQYINSPSLLFRHNIHTFDLLPSNEIHQQSEGSYYQWRSVGGDPAFDLALRKKMPWGWTRISYKITSNSPCICSKLYYSTGQGFNEEETLLLPVSLKGKVNIIVWLPNDIKRLRLDPLECPGDFSITNLEFTEIGLFERIALMLRRVVPVAIATVRCRGHLQKIRPRPVRFREIFTSLSKTYYDLGPKLKF